MVFRNAGGLRLLLVNQGEPVLGGLDVAFGPAGAEAVAERLAAADGSEKEHVVAGEIDAGLVSLYRRLR